MKQWPIGEIRRIERSYSPKYNSFGYYMLGSFIKKVPDTIDIIMNTYQEPIILVQNDGFFKVVAKYYYENVPKKFQDRRGQYPNPGYQDDDWKDDYGMVLGFPLRPWIRVPVPCTIEAYHEFTAKENYKTWANSKCESPIEKKFLETAINKGLVLRPQFWVWASDRYYKIDFADVDKHVAIEVDGHEYHSSREQRTHDAQRERLLQKLGWTVIRFTGSEIYSNANKCLDELIELIGTQK
jgi:very-short-patch-repair endonuclease